MPQWARVTSSSSVRRSLRGRRTRIALCNLQKSTKTSILLKQQLKTCRPRSKKATTRPRKAFVCFRKEPRHSSPRGVHRTLRGAPSTAYRKISGRCSFLPMRIASTHNFHPWSLAWNFPSKKKPTTYSPSVWEERPKDTKWRLVPRLWRRRVACRRIPNPHGAY